MKVILECEKGHQWEPEDQWSEMTIGNSRTTYSARLEPCPHCHPPEPTYGPITLADLVDFLSAATANKDGLCAHDYYESEAWAVMDLLGLIDGVAHNDIPHVHVHHSLIEIAERAARAYAEYLGEK